MGIVSLPLLDSAPVASLPMKTGVVIIVGGPQYRAGSHRQFVLLARALAAAGVSVLRFDYRGMGDSTGELRTFEDVNDDVAAAINALYQTAPGIQQIVLWGLCDGASAALLYCHATGDARVRGLCLLNPWVRSQASLAKTQVKHYYTQRLRQKEFWVKLLSGGVASGAVGGLMRNVKIALRGTPPSSSEASGGPFQTRMAESWARSAVSKLLILSEDDYTAKEFLQYADSDTAWSKALDSSHITRRDVADADHTFSSAIQRRLIEGETTAWLQTLTEKTHD